MSPGFLIVIGVISLYTLFGPLVLLGLYIYFDRLSHQSSSMATQKAMYEDKDPALWTENDVIAYLQEASKPFSGPVKE